MGYSGRMPFIIGPRFGARFIHKPFPFLIEPVATETRPANPSPSTRDSVRPKREPAEPRLRAASEMDGGAGEEGKQERHLVLAHKLFLLSHPAVDDLSKVALRAEVLDTVKSDGTVPAAPLLCPLPPMRGS